LHSLLLRLCSQMPLPPHSVHLSLLRLSSHKLLPPHFLHLLLLRPYSQVSLRGRFGAFSDGASVSPLCAGPSLASASLSARRGQPPPLCPGRGRCGDCSDAASVSSICAGPPITSASMSLVCSLAMHTPTRSGPYVGNPPIARSVIGCDDMERSASRVVHLTTRDTPVLFSAAVARYVLPALVELIQMVYVSWCLYVTATWVSANYFMKRRVAPPDPMSPNLGSRGGRCNVQRRVQEPYRGRARFVQKLTFYIVTRPKLMFFKQNFKGFPMPQLLFKLSCEAQGFFPAKRAFCPFCHIYARALSPNINILQADQAKINIFCVQFQELSNGALTCQLIV